MKNLKLIILILSSIVVTNLKAQNIIEMMPTISSEYTQESPNSIWNKYCLANRESVEIPIPNYNNDKIQSVVRKLVTISPYSYYFYSGPLYSYNLKDKKGALVNPPDSFNKVKLNGVTPVYKGKQNAHAFLTLLCGEFRDRPTLIEAKLNWIQRMVVLKSDKQEQIKINDNNVWNNLTAESYSKYIQATRTIFGLKNLYAEYVKGKIQLGSESEQSPIEPFSVCETKFIFNNYIKEDSIKNLNSLIEDAQAVGKSKITERNIASSNSVDPSMEQLDPDTLKQLRQIQENIVKVYKKYIEKRNKYAEGCVKKDKEEFYDFRGDSNFKPNSPESNGMIWYANTIGMSCMRLADGSFKLKDNAKHLSADPDICTKYFKNPFAYRWLAARAGLASWLLYNNTHEEIFSNSNQNVTIIPHLAPEKKPFYFKFKLEERSKPELYVPYQKNEKGEYLTYNDKYELVVANEEQLKEINTQIAKYEEEYQKELADYNNWLTTKKDPVPLEDFLMQYQNNQQEFWTKSDLGFNEIFGLGKKGTKNELKGEAYKRLRNAVNRHTDWYASAYDDGAGKLRDQAYSPFVASSYEMSASDGFTAPGVTVSSPSDGCKHWMFIFRIKKENWYNTESVKNGKAVNFNLNWFDETSLGTNHLADSERALDRLGTALEGEMDSILYLHNLDTTGQVDMSCGQSSIQEMENQNK